MFYLLSCHLATAIEISAGSLDTVCKRSSLSMTLEDAQIYTCLNLSSSDCFEIDTSGIFWTSVDVVRNVGSLGIDDSIVWETNTSPFKKVIV